MLKIIVLSNMRSFHRLHFILR